LIYNCSVRYTDRAAAAVVLAEQLRHYAGRTDVLVLALPCGGVPIGAEIARRIDAPLDVLVVRKLGAPGQRELAIGAIAASGVRVLNDDIVAALNVTAEQIEQTAALQLEELTQRMQTLRGAAPPVQVAGRCVIVVDDGLATGATMRAAVTLLRSQAVARLVVAVPVGAAQACRELEEEVDELICPLRPDPFFAVGVWYDDFEQLTDTEVKALLK
jgi:putative phosphoribosyl transferase